MTASITCTIPLPAYTSALVTLALSIDSVEHTAAAAVGEQGLLPTMTIGCNDRRQDFPLRIIRHVCRIPSPYHPHSSSSKRQRLPHHAKPLASMSARSTPPYGSLVSCS